MKPGKKLAMAGALMALTCAATMVLVIPIPTGGYVNPGDAVVLLGAYLLGPVYGAAAAGIGAAMADLLAGYTMYVPGTLVIKGLMALLAGKLYHGLPGRGVGKLVCIGAAAEILMVAGYWLYDGLLLGSLAGAAAGVPGNLVQGCFGTAVSACLTVMLRKAPYVRKLFPGL